MVSTLVAYAIMELGMSYAIATFAVNFALSLIVTRVFSENPETQQDMGVRQQVPPSAVNAIPVVYGNAYMGGTFVDAVLTTDQKTMYYVLAISSISPNGQFAFDTADMYYGDRKITFDSSDLTKVISLTDEAGNVDTKISGNLYISLYTSTAGGTITSANGASAPSTVMGGSDIASGQRWTGTRQMNGLGFAIVKLIYNRDADTTQLQPITFKVAHTLNGTGVAKAGDVWYDYITNSVYGGAVDAAFVNSASATALNAYGDQLITFTNSSGAPSTQARYRINGVLDAGQTVLSNIDRIMSACDSWMTYNAALGQWSVVINKAESAAYAFNDNNIIGEIRVSATDITSSINQVEARFPFKENRDQAAFVNIETPSGLLYPNEPVNKYSITYDLVNESVQAHYLANRLLEQAREDLIVGFSTTYYGIQVEAGDVVSVTNADYGWSSKLFRVMKVNEASLPDGSLGARLELNEYNAQVYDDQDITQFTPIPNSGLSSPVFFSALTAPTATGFPSAVVPNVSVQVFVPVTGRVTFINLFFTTSATPSASDWKLLASASSSNSQPIGNNFNYTFTNNTINTGTYYFAYIVGNEIGQSALSTASSAFVWNPIAPAGQAGPLVDISGFTVFSKSSAGVITPSTATLTAVTENVTSPTYAWAITGATPTSGAASAITITPDSGATSVTASLTVNGSNLASAITRTITMAIVDDGINGTTGVQTARPTVFQWALSTPSISGSTTYTWATGAYTAPSGWATTITSAPTAGYILYAATVPITAAATDTTTTINWTTASIIVSGYAGTNGTDGTDGTDGTNGTNGTNGSSARIMYARIASNPTPVSGTVTVAGDNRPTGAQGSAVWGASFNVTWYANDPSPSSNDSLYQADGIYNGTSTFWSTPYISSLKVGALSAVSTNTGSLTISGTLQSNTAAISGTTMTGSGGVLYSSGNFAFGDSSTNISYNGSQMTLNGNVVATANINANAVTLISSAFTSANFVNTVLGTWEDAQTITIVANGSPIYIAASGSPIQGQYIDGENTGTIVPQFRLVRGSTVLMNGGYNPSMSYSDTPTAATYIYRIQVFSEAPSGSALANAGLSNRSLFAIETKR